MITNKEITAVDLSPTKKDFYQIWNELLDTAGKISNRWDPTSTNEADPGIVLLKVLAALGDKLNYNIDKNILEAYMPSATQEESMRRLCDMLGYTMKYYQSATTTVNISYKGEGALPSSGKTIDAFTNIKNNEDDINYFTLAPITLTTEQTSKAVEVMEGELCECESDDDNIISVALLDDNYRYYLPEDKIAENGIFVQNYSDGFLSELWECVDNLNTQPLDKKIYKFGYSSSKQMPYIQFPEDINDIIEDGLYIRYTRTNGVNGNISAGVLTKLEKPESWSDTDTTSDYSVSNTAAATNGANPETINQAYNSYKKTIGTFDTLVTCRDYMNKIYQMVTSDTDTTPLVSNIIVSDIRDDINKAVTLCTFSEYGMCYQNIAKEAENANKEIVPLINSFDLVLYPFKTYFNLGKKDDYLNSFKYTAINNYEIKANLAANKTIAHNIIEPDSTDIACIKNYVRLNAKIVTIRKVNSIEEQLILNNVYKALYAEFNMRMLEFGEQIPMEVMLECIKNADSRIKDVYWSDDPKLITAFCLVNGTELTEVNNKEQYDKTYNALVLNNVLAGRIPLLAYNDDFAYSYNINTTAIYPNVVNPAYIIDHLTSAFTPKFSGEGAITLPLELKQNELIQFRAPNFRTSKTYSAYVWYFFRTTRVNEGALVCSAGTVYKLQGDDELYIKYTTTTTDSDGTTTSDIKYEYYDANDNLIIRPNFDLYNQTGSTKVNAQNIGPFNDAPSGKQTLEKMYSLGANDQIEVINKSLVDLDKAYTFLYWHRNDEASHVDNNNRIIFTFDEDNGRAYTLKDGEYLCYTDINKTDFVVYSSGTQIVHYGVQPIYKELSDTEISAEEILEQGLSAAIPWRQYTFVHSDDQTVDSDYLTLNEYQYITLGEGDALTAIEFTNLGANSLTQTFTPIKSASYKYKDSEDTPLSTFNMTDISWEARSILQINMGPAIDQYLHNFDSISIYYKEKEIDPETGKEKEIDVDTPTELAGNDTNPLVLNADYICNTANSYVDTRNRELTTNGTETKVSDFKIRKKTLDSQAIQEAEVNNYGTNLTKLILTINKGGQPDSRQLNIRDVSETNYGLMMIYNTAPSDTDITNNCYITTTSTKPLVIYNLYETDPETGEETAVETWWPNYHIESSIGDFYYLKPGINMIKFTEDCNISICQPTDAVVAYALIFDILKTVKGINPKLAYAGDDDVKRLADILAKIRSIDTTHAFYYSADLDSSNQIDLNSNDDTVTLKSALSWYDYNNINNKFVISELDADYLSKGITLTLSSKI